MKKLLILPLIFALLGCDECDDIQRQDTMTGKLYTPIKICSIEGNTDESCEEYRATKYTIGSNYLFITTVDNRRYAFNHAGWSISIKKR